MTAQEHHNLHPESLRKLEQGLLLPVMEMFYSVQGEGFHTGKAAWFIRMGGCDVGCHWCDVKESWDASVHPLTPVNNILEKAAAVPSRSVVITGGEPLTYNLEPLCHALKNAGMTIHLETSGCWPLSGHFDWICLSPKSGQPPRPDMLLMADELKVIIHDESDLRWAEENAEKVKAGCQLFLQPEWSQFKVIMPVVADYVMSHPAWMISLQAHKFMNIP